MTRLVDFLLWVITKLPTDCQIEIAKKLAHKYLGETVGIDIEEFDFATHVFKRLIK